jgi:hypothetical protein
LVYFSPLWYLVQRKIWQPWECPAFNECMDWLLHTQESVS